MYIPIEIKHTVYLTEEQYKDLQQQYDTATKVYPAERGKPEFEDFINLCASMGSIDHISRIASTLARAAEAKPKKGA